MAGEDQQEHDPLVGTVFADRYLITGRLGKGGMAVVYRATDRNLGRDVAVKVLRKDVAADPVAAKRLVREARAAASLHHPHIITILDVGERNGTVYVVMELLTGRSLADVLEQDGALPLERALPIAEQLASALVVAHGQGIIHRDIKPENLYLIEHGGTGDFLKVLDFSIAKLPTEMVTAALTRAGSVFGTPHYMAPEQVEGKGVGPQTDLYAAGAVLYEMITGDPPFDGPSVIDILLKHVKSPPPTIQVPGLRLPPGLNELVTRLLAKKVADRPANAGALRDELARMISELPREGEGGDPPHAPGLAGQSQASAAVAHAAAPAASVMDFLPPALPQAAKGAAPGPGAGQSHSADAASLAVDLARGHAGLTNKATVSDLPDLPDAPPAAAEPHGPAEGKRKFAGFGEPDAPEQRTLVGVGVAPVVREMARQRGDAPGPSHAAASPLGPSHAAASPLGPSHAAASPLGPSQPAHSPALPQAPNLPLPPPPPSHPAPVPADAGLQAPGGISAPTAVQVIPQGIGVEAGTARRSGAKATSDKPAGDKLAGDRAAGEQVPPSAATAIHRNRSVSGATKGIDHGRAQTEPMGSIGAGTGRATSGKAPPPPPGALASHTRRPPPRPAVDDRQPTQPSLPGDAAALVRQQRHQQDTVLPPSAPPPAASAKSSKGLWIALGVAGAVALAVAAWLLLAGSAGA